MPRAIEPAEPAMVADGGVSDRQLLRGARNGDRRAFAELIRLKVPTSFRFAAAVLGNDADAADATQNAFIAAWRELPRFRDVDRFEPWLRRILVNECRMQLRHRGRGETGAPDPEGIGSLVGASAATNPRADALEALTHAFDRLDADDRILVVMQLLESRSIGDMAEAVRMPIGTTRVRL